MTGHPKPQRLRPSAPAVLALGSNLGDREGTIRTAVEEIDAIGGVSVDAVSSLVETPAVRLDGVDASAPRYLNAVVAVHTALEPHDLLAALHDIENRHGRVRTERWGDRTLDIDIVDVAGRILNDETLTLPHPRAAERGFVLAPWHELHPDAVLAGRGPISELLAGTDDEVTSYPSGRLPSQHGPRGRYAKDTEGTTG